MKKIIIAIDGFSSCGKSTTAKQLAKKLNYIFIDSGAMYRAITYFFITSKVDITQDAAVKDALSKITLSFQNSPITDASEIYLNGVNVATDIRTKEVNDAVSNVAALGRVRTFAVMQQQLIGQSKGIVMDGRDIGTTVFPNAELKIFMTAQIDVRVERRWQEVQDSGLNMSKDEVKENLEKRDYIDSHREISPLRQATDAKVLDNTDLTMEQQLNVAYDWAVAAMDN